jgi:hypothetical protein
VVVRYGGIVLVDLTNAEVAEGWGCMSGRLWTWW